MRKYYSNELSLAKCGSSQIQLENDLDSNQLFSYFLRDHRGRNDLVTLLDIAKPTDIASFVSKLEKIRNHIENGEYALAKSQIEITDSVDPIEKIELALENARCYFFKNHWKECRSIVDAIIKQQETLPTTRMTAYQLYGICCYELGDPWNAVVILEKVMQFWRQFPYSHSGAVAAAYLIKILSELNMQSAAIEKIEQFKINLDQIDSDESWLPMHLVYVRALYHFHKSSDFNQARIYFQESEIIARWLNNLHIIDKCENEKMHCPDLMSELNLIIFGNNWKYLQTSKILLLDQPKNVFRLESSPVLQAILKTVGEGIHDEADVFQSVWGIKYAKERHANHLRATLSSLRKKLPPGSLTVKDKKIYLKMAKSTT